MSTATLSKKERFLLTVQGKETDRPPIWIMRQAGRYMPEYMELKQRYSFRDFCLKPEVAVEATLLPLRLLDIDIMIIFNDILIPLEEMGLPVEFPNGGPVISGPLREEGDLERFVPVSFTNPPVAQSIALLKKTAGPDVPVLGFCGAPFTLAVYAVEGKMSKDQHNIKGLLYERRAMLHEVLDRLTDTAAAYLISQIVEGGADGVQIFESWGGILPMPHDYEEFGAFYQRRLIAKVREVCPDTPIILYVRGGAGKIPSMAETGADVVGVDQTMSLAQARQLTTKTLQGNLDPMALINVEAVEREFPKTLEGFDWRRGWIANLGHGITPQGNMAAAKRFVELVQALKSGG